MDINIVYISGESEDDKAVKEEEARLLHDQLQAPSSASPREGAEGDGRRESAETESISSVHSDSLLLAENANDVSILTLSLF